MTTQQPEQQRSRPPVWIAFAALAIGFAAGLFTTILVALISTAFGASAGHPTPAVNIINNYLFDAAFVVAALYFTVIGGWMGRGDFGYRRVSWRQGGGAVILAGFAYYVVTLIYAAALHLHGTDRLPSGLGIKTSTWAAIFTALFVCAVAPMAEEFFFRGFLFGVLSRIPVRLGGRELGPWLAAVLVGLLFGAAHLGSARVQFLFPLAFLGFVLCLVRWRTGSLYPCMALHAINNSVALGVNELGLGGGEIIGLMVGSLALIALVTGPLSSRGSGGAAHT